MDKENLISMMPKSTVRFFILITPESKEHNKKKNMDAKNEIANRT